MVENSSSRWWEFYAVRYAMGTVFGAVVFYFLCSANPGWRALLFDNSGVPIADMSIFHLVPIRLDKMQMTLLITYGLVYCYIASAPILVFHATRFLLDYRLEKREWLWWFLRYLLVPVTGAGGIWWSTNRLLWAILGLIFAFILWGQYWLGANALLKRRQLYAFYEKLSKRREQAHGGILDSYRHLREHGNSFFIVLLEVVLGLVLFGVGRYQIDEKLSDDSTFMLYLGILFLWIVPSVGVWFIATSFEREFSEAALQVVGHGEEDSAKEPAK